MHLKMSSTNAMVNHVCLAPTAPNTMYQGLERIKVLFQYKDVVLPE